ncbi:MAG: hypothetical protein AB7P22_14570, partial [Vicinamibacterales bacterium]
AAPGSIRARGASGRAILNGRWRKHEDRASGYGLQAPGSRLQATGAQEESTVGARAVTPGEREQIFDFPRVVEGAVVA